MESSPNLSGIPRFVWRFTPRLLGAANQAFVLQLYNPGLLPTEFMFKFPTDRDLEPEPWADEGIVHRGLTTAPRIALSGNITENDGRLRRRHSFCRTTHDRIHCRRACLF